MLRDTAMTRQPHPLQHVREDLGWTQRELAEKVRRAARALGTSRNVDANTVSRWERGVTPISPPYARLLCQVLAASPAELGLADAGPQPAAPDREQVAGALRSRRWVDQHLLDVLEELTHLYARERTILDSAVLLPLVRRHLAYLKELLAQHAGDDRLARHLRELVALTAWLTGQLAWTAWGRRSDALALASEAQQLATVARSPRVLAMALLLQSHWYSAVLNDQRAARSRTARALLDEAVSVGARGSTLAEVRIYRAEEAALNGDRAWERDIDAVAAIIGRRDHDPVYGYFDSSILTIFRGECMHLQGDPRAATSEFLDAYRGLKPRLLLPDDRAKEAALPINPCLLYAQIAAASADLGEPEHAHRLLLAAIQLAPDAFSLQRIRQFRDEQLARHRRLDLTHLDDELALASVAGSGRRVLSFQADPTTALRVLGRGLV
jgi:transcriptional regulator with XRE-family HTH domain